MFRLKISQNYEYYYLTFDTCDSKSHETSTLHNIDLHYGFFTAPGNHFFKKPVEALYEQVGGKKIGREITSKNCRKQHHSSCFELANLCAILCQLWLEATQRCRGGARRPWGHAEASWKGGCGARGRAFVTLWAKYH